MTIGFSDGTTYDSAIGLHLGQEQDNSYHKELGESSTASRRPSKATEKPTGELLVDREHHVPLLASAIMGEDGQMAGLAIDHRAQLKSEDAQHLALHEATELPLMNDYITDGMKPSDAYAKAHPIATATETAAVRAHAIRTGQDPDKYKEDYDQRMRDAASIAKEPTDRERHPDAHTTRYALDEHELGHEIKPLQIDVLGAGTKIHSGPGMPSKVPANVNTNVKEFPVKEDVVKFNRERGGKAPDRPYGELMKDRPADFGWYGHLKDLGLLSRTDAEKFQNALMKQKEKKNEP